MRWAAGASPAEVAALAPHVLDVAAHGDILAQGIADYAARELTQLALCLLPMLDVEPPVGVALTGGLLSTDGRSAGACWRGSGRSRGSCRSSPSGRGRGGASAGGAGGLGRRGLGAPARTAAAAPSRLWRIP